MKIYEDDVKAIKSMIGHFLNEKEIEELITQLINERV